MTGRQQEESREAVKTSAESPKLPPDGGWGWMVVLAYATMNLLVLATMSFFTLIFRDRFAEANLSATDISLIINVNAGIGIGVGFMLGPLLKTLGYRKAAFIGGILLSGGIISTSWANSFAYFFVTHSLVTAAGQEICAVSLHLAMNTYFKVKRAKAFGYALAIGGTNFIFYPQLIKLLLTLYGITGTCLVVGGLSLHIFAAASLLQPVKHHLRVAQESEAAALLMTTLNSERAAGLQRGDELPQPGPRSNGESNGLSRSADVSLVTAQEGAATSSTTKSSTFVKHLDLELLKDIRFLGLVIGIALIIFSEINFSLLTPLILTEFGYNLTQIADSLSVMGVVDIAFRFIAPFIGDALHLSAQAMCTFSLVATVVCRVYFSYIETYWQLMGVSVALGVVKGCRYVYWSLVIPAYVPLHRLPSAAGIQTAFKGLFTIVLGVLLGVVRDVTGSYIDCIFYMNLATCVTIFMWTADLLLAKRDKKSRNQA